MEKKQFRQYIIKLLKSCIRLFFPVHTVIGAEKIDGNSPSIFVCNHLNSYGPIAMELYFPYEFRPWVLDYILSFKDAVDYLELDYTKRELKLKKPYSRWLAIVIAPFCMGIMKLIKAIPVYVDPIKLCGTFINSVEALREGDNLLIFPENRKKKYSEYIDDLETGFIYLAELYYEETGKNLNFYPIYVDKNKKTIKVGHPAIYSKGKDFEEERLRIGNQLRDTLDNLARSEAERGNIDRSR